MKQVAGKVQREYWGLQATSWKVWPVAALVSYTYVPVEWRVLFANGVALGW